jgi:quercetin dioxygenase-like cupin family protein
MMKNKSLGLLVIFYILSTNVNANNNILLVKENDKLKWIDMPNSAGKYIVIAGDPKKEDLFVVRVKFPPNYSIAPHHHNHYEYDTVISGSCYIAQGKVLKKENGLLATAGTFVSIPPHLIHYGWTGPEGAIIQLSGMGPWKPIYE